MSKAEDRSPHYGDEHGDENSADDEEENVRPPWPPVISVGFHSTIVMLLVSNHEPERGVPEETSRIDSR